MVTLPSLDGRDIADVTFDIGKKWQVGQKHSDNGVVFAIAPEDKKMRIEVGKGLEGALTDLQTQTIQQEIVIPHFRSGDFDTGILQGSTAIVQAIRGEFKAPAHAVARTQQSGSSWPTFVVIGILILLFIMFPRAGMLLLFSGFGGRGGGGGGGGGGGFSGGGGSFGGGGSSSSW